PISMHKWVGHLSSLYQRNPSPVPNVVLQRAHRALAALNEPFGPAEIEASVNSAPNGKAAGPDALAYEHIKLSLPALLPYWTELFNVVLQQGKLPMGWLHSYTKLFYKGKGERTDVNSYRGLALNTVVYKLF